MESPIIVGAHHKTGTVLAELIIKQLVATTQGIRPNGRLRIHAIPCHLRKWPLSAILKLAGQVSFAKNAWFEHEIDTTDIRLLHFVREPLLRIASGYLYHRRGAPSDTLKWVDWAIFQFKGRKSYCELLNELSLSDGLFVESIRTFPEALGTARAFKTSFRLKAADRVNIWLDEFTARPADSLDAISRLYWGTERKQAAQFLERTRASNIVLNADSPAVKRGHITKDDSLRSEVEHALNESDEIAVLYQHILRDMQLSDRPTRCTDDFKCQLIAEIDEFIPFLNAHPEAHTINPSFWHNQKASLNWEALVLSSFANGHLMMLPFIQKYIARLERGAQS